MSLTRIASFPLRSSFRITFLLIFGLSACLGASAQTNTPVSPAADQSIIPTHTAGAPTDTAQSQRSGHFNSMAPAPPPLRPTDRPRIGLALGGGGALAMSEIGVLQWFEEHHIPVDMIAGTSMGCMVSALYSSGKDIDQLKAVMNDQVFNSVFSLGTSYKALNYRRREDGRALPNAITVGLKHGVSFRNSVLVDQGLNAFLDRQFLPYNDRTDFNTLPIPLRCKSTDLNDAKSVTFARGSLPDAVRASVSIPGIYRPYEIDGHEFVDGAVLENLPTQTIIGMKADVVLAVSLPLSKVGRGDLNSILGVLQRSFSVAIEANEAASRKLAAVVIEPDVSGFTATDYLKTVGLAEQGYKATESHKAELLKYAVNDQQWAVYLAQRAARLPGPPGTVLHVRVKAPNEQVTHAVQKAFLPIVDQPVDAGAIEALLDQIRSDGRYDADYTIGYETNLDTDQTTSRNPTIHQPASAITNRPVVTVTISDKKTGPPFLQVGANVEAQTGGVTRATLEGILVDQDLGGYGSELRARIAVGFLTDLTGEYYRRIASLGQTQGGLFIAPSLVLHREPFYIYQNQQRISERQLQHTGGGIDVGWSDQRVQELRLGWQMGQERWQTETGSDTLAPANLVGSMQLARIRYVYDNQDRALVPQYGFRVATEAAYLYNAVDSPNAPQITSKISYSHQITSNIFVMAAEGGTMFNRDVSQPFRFTLGGPLRLTASAIDEYRGTDYFLFEPAFLRRIAKLPSPLGQSIYLGAAYEAGQMRAPDARTITRQDAYFGIVAETPLGIITIAPAIGDDGHRKFVFTLGKLF
jgi:NTE family protein